MIVYWLDTPSPLASSSRLRERTSMRLISSKDLAPKCGISQVRKQSRYLAVVWGELSFSARQYVKYGSTASANCIGIGKLEFFQMTLTNPRTSANGAILPDRTKSSDFLGIIHEYIICSAEFSPRSFGFPQRGHIE